MTGEHPTIPEQPPKKEKRVTFNPDLFFANREDLLAYKQWKAEAPAELRRVFENFWQDLPVSIEKEATPLLREYYSAVGELLGDPNITLDEDNFSIPIINSLGRLVEAKEKIGEQTHNLFQYLQNPNRSFTILKTYLEKFIEEMQALSNIEKLRLEQYLEEAEEEKIKINSHPEQPDAQVGRAPMSESKEKPTEALATVYPFYGGYYKGKVYSEFDINSFTWKPDQTEYVDLPSQQIDQAKKRIYRSDAFGDNVANIIKLPYSWGIDQTSIKWIDQTPTDFKFIGDSDGLVYLQIDDETSFPFELSIGPSPQYLKCSEPKESNIRVTENFPSELENKTVEILSSDDVSDIIKAKRMVSFIQSHLEYDLKDDTLDGQYKSEPQNYFVAIWNNKKAKCDEANTMAARLLQKNGFQVRYITGHSVQTKSDAGEALILDSNRHAWIEVWDNEQHNWVRMDATPAGDPNMDEDEQQQDLGEGDYGEQEAKDFSDEEVEKRLKAIDEAEKLAEEEAEKYTDEEKEFAQDADCEKEEAREVLNKIQELQEKYASEREQMIEYWRQAVRKNYRLDIQYTGPVEKQMSNDEITEGELVPIVIQRKSGVSKENIVGYNKNILEEKSMEAFGGFEIYIAVDLSGSMNQEIDGVRKVDAQRDMAFLLADSIMSASEETNYLGRMAPNGLRTEMPVRICLASFGAKTEIILPPSGQWGAKEKLAIYRALSAGAGSDTPDDKVLTMMEQKIGESVSAEQEENDRLRADGKEVANINRLVVVVADGGSNSAPKVKLVRERLEKNKVPVGLFLIAPKDNERILTVVREAYGEKNYSPIRKPSELPVGGVKWVVDNLIKTYKLAE